MSDILQKLRNETREQTASQIENAIEYCEAVGLSTAETADFDNESINDIVSEGLGIALAIHDGAVLNDLGGTEIAFRFRYLLSAIIRRAIASETGEFIR